MAVEVVRPCKPPGRPSVGTFTGTEPMRPIFLTLCLICLTTRARAQDLPLRDILLDGQGWVARLGTPFAEPRPQTRGTPDMRFDGSVFGWDGPRTRVATARTRDGATLLGVNETDPWVYAVPCADGIPTKAGSKYAPLRLPRGETKSGAGTIVLDTVGRIYVATTVGVQVFDPTGRLCGVMHPPAAGPLEDLAWAGPDRATLIGRAGGKTYERLMNVSGAP
jgi:hypothetical protein